MKKFLLMFFTALFVCLVATPVVQADVNEFEIVVANSLVDFEQVEPDGLLAKTSIKYYTTMSKQDELYTANIAKIQQDKLNQRRTVLSSIDQEFVDKTVEFGAAIGAEVDKSILSVASEKVQEGLHKLKNKAKAKAEATDNNEDSAEPAGDGVPTAKNTKKEIQAHLTSLGIEFETDANKDALLALIPTIPPE